MADADDQQLCTAGASNLAVGLRLAAGLLVLGLSGFGILVAWLLWGGSRGEKGGEEDPATEGAPATAARPTDAVDAGAAQRSHTEDGSSPHTLLPAPALRWSEEDGAWVTGRHAAVSRLPLHPLFSEDYMPALLDQLSPEGRTRWDSHVVCACMHVHIRTGRTGRTESVVWTG
jgi:hypothetical protein